MNPKHQNFRQTIVSSIMEIKEAFEGISRNSMFLAISVFDFYLKKITDQNSANLGESSHAKSYALACYMIAWKFQGDSHPKISLIKETLKIAELTQQDLTFQVITLQQEILIKIDFNIPTTTAYQSLDSIVAQDDLNNNMERRDIARSIKVMLTAVVLTWDLSFDPSLGAEIHQITKKTSSPDHKARNIYRRCLKSLQKEQNTIKQCSITTQ